MLYMADSQISVRTVSASNLIALVVLIKPFFGLVKDWESGERKYDTAITDKNHHYIKMCKSYEEELARQEQSGK